MEELLFRSRFFYNEFDTTVLFTSSYFFRAATFLEQLLFQVCHFFSEVSFFYNNCNKADFSKELPFKNKVFFQKSCFLETAYFFRKQYAVTYFFRRGFFTQLYFLSTFALLIYKLIHITLVSDVCVCLYSFTVKASSLFNDAWVYRWTILCCEYYNKSFWLWVSY